MPNPDVTTIQPDAPIRPTGKRLLGRLTSNGYFFVLPAVLYILVLGAYPVLQVVKLSFMKSDLFTLVPSFTGLSNYAKALTDPVFWVAFRQSVMYVAASTALHLGIGLAAAILFNQNVNRRFLTASRSLAILPWTITPVVVAGLWRLIFHPDLSFVAPIVQSLGIGLDWNVLGEPSTALLGVIVANVWNFTPFYMLMILARLQAIPEDMYEAAAIDGASAWKTFRHMTLPQLKDTLVLLGIFDVVGTFTQFELIWVTTGGGPLTATETLSTYAYRLGFQSFDFGYSSAVAVLTFLAMGLMVALGLGFGKRGNA